MLSNFSFSHIPTNLSSSSPSSFNPFTNAPNHMYNNAYNYTYNPAYNNTYNHINDLNETYIFIKKLSVIPADFYDNHLTTTMTTSVTTESKKKYRNTKSKRNEKIITTESRTKRPLPSTRNSSIHKVHGSKAMERVTLHSNVGKENRVDKAATSVFDLENKRTTTYNTSLHNTVVRSTSPLNSTLHNPMSRISTAHKITSHSAPSKIISPNSTPYDTISHNTISHNTISHNTISHNTTPYHTTPHNTTPFNTTMLKGLAPRRNRTKEAKSRSLRRSCIMFTSLWNM